MKNGWEKNLDNMKNKIEELNEIVEKQNKEIERLRFLLKIKEKKINDLEEWKAKCYGYGKEN